MNLRQFPGRAFMRVCIAQFRDSRVVGLQDIFLTSTRRARADFYSCFPDLPPSEVAS